VDRCRLITGSINLGARECAPPCVLPPNVPDGL
jgi:hypothetical protein